MAEIHPTAVVHPGARLEAGVEIGPLSVIGDGVRLGPRCRIGAQVMIEGETDIGADNRIESHAVLGGLPQIREARDRGGTLVLGDGNWIREFVTIHRARDGGVTRIGRGNLLMAYSHVAHDCVLGDGIELANLVQLAGHVEVGDQAGFGGLSAVHQFVRVGAHAFVAAGAMVSQDVPPFSLVAGDRARVYGLNLVGLRRRGFQAERRAELARALRLLLCAPTMADGIREVMLRVPPSVERDQLLAFAEHGRRGLCAPTPRRSGRVRPPPTEIDPDLGFDRDEPGSGMLPRRDRPAEPE